MTMLQGKIRLVSELCILLRNFVFGQQLAKDFKKNPCVNPVITFRTETGDEERIDVRSLYVNAENQSLIEPKEVLQQFRRSLSRSVVAESYEAILFYCRETNQTQKHLQSNFYQFTRIMRHITSHGKGGFLTQWPPNLSKRGIYEVHWRNKVINSSMIGQRVGLNDLDIIRLLKEEIDFVEKELD
jgi:hypothetical protein